jgi:hypothetical protein
MNFDGFCGGTYQGRALALDAERAQNCFPERSESQGAASKARFGMLSKPGKKVFATLAGAASVKAECQINGRAFAVAGGSFWEVKSDGSAINYGPVGDQRAQLEPSQSQVLILVAGAGYVFKLADSTLTPITADGWLPGITKIGSNDTYFVALVGNSQTFILSGINDGLNWDPLDFGSAGSEPGNIVSFVVDHRQLWFLGNTHSEIFYDSGNADFPFTRLEGAFMEQGTCAIDSVSKIDNSIIWLGGNRDGAKIFWRANGYTPQRISTHSIEALLDSFGDVSDASAYPYQEGGHTFYRADFPSANGGRGATLLYDVASGFWHERTFFSNGLDYADRARTHMYVFGKHLVGDWMTGTIYEQSMDYLDDAGSPIRFLRAAPDLSAGGMMGFYGELRLIMQTGVGLDGNGAGSDPQVILQISDDGGFTWSDDMPASIGRIGQYQWLVRWSALGSSRNRAFRVIITDPVFKAIFSADLDATYGN